MSPRDDTTVPFVRRLARGLGGREGIGGSFNEMYKKTPFSLETVRAPSKFSDFLKGVGDLNRTSFRVLNVVLDSVIASMLQRCLNLKSV